MSLVPTRDYERMKRLETSIDRLLDEVRKQNTQLIEYSSKLNAIQHALDTSKDPLQFRERVTRVLAD